MTFENVDVRFKDDKAFLDYSTFMQSGVKKYPLIKVGIAKQAKMNIIIRKQEQ
jgi:hypothetical protein